MSHLISVLVGLFILAVDLGFGGLLGFGTIKPSLLLPFVVFSSLRHGPVYGTIAGFILGFFTDAMGGSPLGTSSLALSVAGFMPGHFWSTGPFRVHWPWGTFLLICSILFELIRHLIIARETGHVFSMLFLESGIPSALYTTILGVIWFLSPLNRDRSV
jgi:rod shape-determining protein MreD